MSVPIASGATQPVSSTRSVSPSARSCSASRFRRVGAVPGDDEPRLREPGERLDGEVEALVITTRPEARNTGGPAGGGPRERRVHRVEAVEDDRRSPATERGEATTSASVDREHAVTCAAPSRTRASALRGSSAELRPAPVHAHDRRRIAEHRALDVEDRPAGEGDVDEVGVEVADDRRDERCTARRAGDVAHVQGPVERQPVDRHPRVDVLLGQSLVLPPGHDDDLVAAGAQVGEQPSAQAPRRLRAGARTVRRGRRRARVRRRGARRAAA